MKKTKNNLTDAEKSELQQLIAKKKSNSLTDEEQSRLAELNEKIGFKGGKSNSKEKFVPGNDFSWWNKRAELLKDATNFKCNYVAGEQLGDSFPYVVPGVLMVNVIDTFGIATKQTDPLNVWTRDLYLKMFQKYRVANGYSQADLGITIIATIMLFALIAYYERIYGVINRYSVLNVNMPFTETRALGIPDSLASWLRGHLSDFRYDLNELISRAQRVCLPKDLSIVADKISLYGYEYLDHASKRSQIIMFRPKYYAEYEDTALTTGGAIKFEFIDYSNPNTFFDKNAENMCTLLEGCIDKLLNSSSVVKMYADLVTWFGEDAMLHLLPMPEEYVVLPTYSESILHKLHNCESVIYGELENEAGTLTSAAKASMPDADANKVLSGYWIYQYDDVIISRPVVSGPTDPAVITDGQWKYSVSGSTHAVFQLNEHLLDTYREDVNSETVTEGALFKITMEEKHNSDNERCYPVKSCGFEWICDFTLHSTDEDRDVTFHSNFFDDSEATNFAARMAVIDWAPLSYYGNDFDLPDVNDVFGDIDNVIMISNTALHKIHRAVLYSGLQTDVKVIGK